VARPLGAAAGAPVERRLWIVVEAARCATASVRPHPLGDELVLRVAGELLQSWVFRPDEAEGLQVEAERARTAFLGRGWEPAA
jgi:hypothetical protein